MKTSWNVALYNQFLNTRTRPARDLLAAIPKNFQPEMVYDLGSGPGNSTALLKKRWPQAKIIGVDNSEEMLNEARNVLPDIQFVEGDIGHFQPDEKTDCLFANASLQWLAHHEQLIPQLLKTLNKDGVFAFQMPNNFHGDLHQGIIQVLQQQSSWQPYLKVLRYGELEQPLYQLSWYYDLLAGSGMTSLDLWETDYLQVMDNQQKLFDWISGTALSPVLSQMNAEEQNHFKHAYLQYIREKFPLQSDNKILLTFRRIFMVGRA